MPKYITVITDKGVLNSWPASWPLPQGYKIASTEPSTSKIVAEDRSAASLQGTLNQSPDSVSGKELPQVNTDNLASFRNLLRITSQRAAQEAAATGVAGMGFEPSTVSGGTLAGVVDFIKKQKTQGISDIYKSTVDLLDNQQKQAQNQLQLLVTSGGISELTDSALAKLSSTAGMDYELLASIRKQKQEEAAKPSSFSVVDKGGKKVRIGFDKMGNIISETEIGEATEGKGFTSLTDTQKDNVINWMSQQPGFSPTDLKKMDEDENFYNFIISEYYKQEGL